VPYFSQYHHKTNTLNRPAINRNPLKIYYKSSTPPRIYTKKSNFKKTPKAKGKMILPTGMVSKLREHRV
jgi:hypothetical protein